MERKISSDKSTIRKEVLARRDALSPHIREKADIAMADRIIGHQWFYRAEVVWGFVNYGSEISTEEILQEAIKKGKKLFLPKVVGDDMIFYRVEDMTDLQSGYKGIREPFGDTEVFDYTSYKDSRMLILIPGTAFDVYGNRMGYGKGFYDRFLADKEILQTYSIGIGYACQRVEYVPVDAHDIKPYQVILL